MTIAMTDNVDVIQQEVDNDIELINHILRSKKKTIENRITTFRTMLLENSDQVQKKSIEKKLANAQNQLKRLTLKNNHPENETLEMAAGIRDVQTFKHYFDQIKTIDKRHKQMNQIKDYSVFAVQLLPYKRNTENYETIKKNFTMDQRQIVLAKYVEMIETLYPNRKVLIKALHDEKGVDLHIVLSNFNDLTQKWETTRPRYKQLKAMERQLIKSLPNIYHYVQLSEEEKQNKKHLAMQEYKLRQDLADLEKEIPLKQQELAELMKLIGKNSELTEELELARQVKELKGRFFINKQKLAQFNKAKQQELAIYKNRILEVNETIVAGGKELDQAKAQLAAKMKENEQIKNYLAANTIEKEQLERHIKRNLHQARIQDPLHAIDCLEYWKPGGEFEQKLRQQLANARSEANAIVAEAKEELGLSSKASNEQLKKELKKQAKEEQGMGF